jgi:GAF domain-containing protein
MLYAQEGQNRALQLQTAAEVSQAASSILDPTKLMQQVVDLTLERFDLYYVGLFMVDKTGEWTNEPGRWAVLRAGTGRAGKEMLAQGHKLEIGGESMIGWCVANEQPRIALDVGKEPVRFSNPMLPETRSEMGLPLISRGEVIGALTIQSSREAAFNEESIAIMKTMAGQVANAIENARLFDQTQATLKEMEAIHRRYLQQAWTEYLESVDAVSYESERPGASSLDDAVLPEIRQAIEEENTVVLAGNGGDYSALVTPITLRGEAIGALGIHADAERKWTSDEISLVEAIVQRMALAAENLRLLDETQRRAARERLISETTSRIRQTLDVQTVLRTAADEIYETFGLDEITIRLGIDETDGGPDQKQGNDDAFLD